MNLTGRTRAHIGVVLLYDPIPLEKVLLDVLKAEFPSVTSYLPDAEALFAEAAEAKKSVQIFSARTEFVDENEGGDFSSDLLNPLNALLSALPPLRIRSFGVNLHIKGTVDGFNVAGEFVTKAFIRDVDGLQEKLKAKIIASAQRFTYGELSRYYDIRVTPEELQGAVLNIQLHRHVEGEIADAPRLLAEMKSAFDDGARELDRVVSLL